MDPLTAFSLACGVIQVIDFSANIVEKCRELYERGASSENKEIESLAKHLMDLSTDLKVPNAAQSSGLTQHLYHDDQDLLELAQQCSRIATELIAELQKLRVQGRQRKWDVIRKAAKVVWKRDSIEEIKRRLEQYRRTLDTRILISLRQHVHLLSNEQSDSFKDLDHKLQKLIIGLARGQNTFDELKGLFQAENRSSKQHISQEFEKHREQIANEASYKRTLESLYFPDIHARQEGIAAAHKQTFEWIFDKSDNDIRPWYNFIDWLENGHGTYWISGKAGCGKSTLMNFIAYDPRTEAALSVWSGSGEVLMLKFFFWSPGTQLQKSLAGLLRSLVYQIMDKFPNLMPVLASFIHPNQNRLQQLPTWTEQRLHTTLRHLLSSGPETYRLCIFIDGLDEFHGDQATLLDLIRYLRQFTRVKLCLSSRPYPSFRDELGSAAMLKLQDLTYPDIRRYVSDKLEGAPWSALHGPYSTVRLQVTVDTIVKKAEGVFLWVKLVVIDHIKGIRNGDDREQLEERLRLLPNEIEGLYSMMLQSIDKVYRKEVAQYLQLLLDNYHVSLFNIALAVHNRIDEVILFSPDISVRDIRHHCESTGERIATICKGFLEVRECLDYQEIQRTLIEHPEDVVSHARENPGIPLEQRDELIKTKCYQKVAVNFLHRTACDFLKENEHGKELLEAYRSENPDSHVSYIKAQLAELVMFPLPRHNRRTQNDVKHIMIKASDYKDKRRVAQLPLIDIIDRCLTMVYQQSQGQPSDSHWCKAWVCADTYISSSFELYSPPKNDRIQIIHPVDFLGCAAWHGLDIYVDHKLELRAERKSSNEAYLLCCVIGGLDELYTFSPSRHFKLIVTLLKRGADPNMKSPTGTVWGFFLQTMHNLHYRQSYSWEEFYPTEWRNTSRAFLESGAKVNERICPNLILYTRESQSAGSFPLHIAQYMIGLDLSALSVLQHCLAYDPGFSETKDSFLAVGAYLHTKCTGIFLEIRCEGYKSRWVDPKLSEQQLSHFMSSTEKRLKALATNPKDQVQAFKLQAEELFQELDIEQLYEQTPQGTELGYYQCSNETKRIMDGPDESSIDATVSPGSPNPTLGSQEEYRTRRPEHHN